MTPATKALNAARSFDFQKQIQFAIALWAVSLIVLVTTAINAGSLFLVHGMAQQRNTAVALAVGARRSALVGARVAQGMALALVGALLGVLLSRIGSEIVRVTLANYIHYTEPAVDYRPLGYAVLLAILIGGIASALPALRATRIDLKVLLDQGAVDGGKDTRRLTTLIHSVQLAFAVVVLYGAALFMQSSRRARSTPLGMNLENVVLGVSLQAQDDTSEAHIRQYWDRVLPLVGSDQAVEADHGPLAEDARFTGSAGDPDQSQHGVRQL